MVAQGDTYVSELRLDHGIADMDASPDALEQLRLGHQALRVFQQVTQYRKGFGLERDRFSIAPQLLVCWIQHELRKRKTADGTHCLCVALSPIATSHARAVTPDQTRRKGSGGKWSIRGHRSAKTGMARRFARREGRAGRLSQDRR